MPKYGFLNKSLLHLVMYVQARVNYITRYIRDVITEHNSNEMASECNTKNILKKLSTRSVNRAL